MPPASQAFQTYPKVRNGFTSINTDVAPPFIPKQLPLTPTNQQLFADTAASPYSIQDYYALPAKSSAPYPEYDYSEVGTLDPNKMSAPSSPQVGRVAREGSPSIDSRGKDYNRTDDFFDSLSMNNSSPNMGYSGFGQNYAQGAPPPPPAPRRSVTEYSSPSQRRSSSSRRAPQQPIQAGPMLQEQRRIASMLSLTQSSPNKEPRTKSLTSASAKYQQQPRQTPYPLKPMEPIPQNAQLLVMSQQGHGNRLLSGSSNSGLIHHTFSLSSKSRSFTSISKLSSSFSTKKFSLSTSLANSNHLGRLDRTGLMSTLNKPAMPKKPGVYPAILSRVAKAFKELVILSINTKDGLEYHDTFSGKMAVDIICCIIRTNDRNLALLLGRSLDAQKLFHDVTYNHRLRDSVHEIYAFNHVYSDAEFYGDELQNGASTTTLVDQEFLMQQLPAHNNQPALQAQETQQRLENVPSMASLASSAREKENATQQTGVNGVFTILTDCYSPTCSRNHLCYSIACPRRLEQQARLNLKPQGGLQRAVSRLSLHDKEESKTLWHETVPQLVLDKLDKMEKMRQELIYEFIYTERDYVKDLEFMTDFYIMPLRNPANNIIPEHQRDTFIQTVFGGVGELLRLAKSMSEALTRRQQQQKPVIETFADVFLEHVHNFDPFIRYSGNKVFASFEHERQQLVNMKYARFLDAIEKKPELRKQDLSSFLIKGVQRPARYQLLLGGILKNTKPESPDYKNLVRAKEEIEKVLNKINIQTGESTDRHKIMVLHRLLGKQTLENKFNFKLAYNNRIIYQVTLNRKRDNEKIDLYLFEHALLLVKHKIQNKRELHKVFEKPIYLPLLFVNSGFEIPTMRSVVTNRYRGSLLADTGIKNKVDGANYIGTNPKLQLNFLGLGNNQVHALLYAEDLTIQSQVLQQIHNQQKKLIETNDLFSLYKFETRRFHGNNKINCAVPCYGGKKLLYGTDSGVWVSTVRSISATSNEKICSDPTMVISKLYVTQMEVLVEYSKLLILSDKTLYEFDLSCTDSLDHVKNTKLGRMILSHVAFFKTGICEGKLLVCGAKTGGTHAISIFEPTNPFDRNQQRNRNRRYDIQEVTFSSEPVSISFLKRKLVVGCTKGFEILALEHGRKEPILDEADPSLDFAIRRETVTPLSIHRLGKDFLLCYAEFVFLINKNGWRSNHDWSMFWEGNPQNVALFFPYLLSFEPGFVEIRDLHLTNLLRALVGENIRFLHSNEHEAMYACEENGYDIIVSIDFLNLKPKGA